MKSMKSYVLFSRSSNTILSSLLLNQASHDSIASEHTLQLMLRWSKSSAHGNIGNEVYEVLTLCVLTHLSTNSFASLLQSGILSKLKFMYAVPRIFYTCPFILNRVFRYPASVLQKISVWTSLPMFM